MMINRDSMLVMTARFLSRSEGGGTPFERRLFYIKLFISSIPENDNFVNLCNRC